MLPKVNNTNNKIAKDKNPNDKNVRPERVQIVKPMLPPAYDRMLRGQSTDKYLDHIQVKFYQKGMSEMSFAIRHPDDGHIHVLNVGDYQSFRNSLESSIKKTKEDEAALQFFRKLESRCWIKCSDHTVEHARRVKSLNWPPLVLHAFNFTQKDIKTKKLTPARMFAIWKERNEIEKEIISKFQREVDPTYDWGETLSAHSLFAERVAREQVQKDKEKIEREKLVLASNNWNDIDELFEQQNRLPLAPQPPVGVEFDTFPFGDVEEEEDSGTDPLNRPLSPKVKKNLLEKGKDLLGLNPKDKKG